MDLDCDFGKELHYNKYTVPKELQYFRPTGTPYAAYTPCPPQPPCRPFPHEFNWSYTGKGDRAQVVVIPLKKQSKKQKKH